MAKVKWMQSPMEVEEGVVGLCGCSCVSGCSFCLFCKTCPSLECPTLMSRPLGAGLCVVNV